MRITVYGIVQGVGFRPTVYRVAKAMGLKGFVLNNGSNVEIHIDRDSEKFLAELKKALPALARIDRAEFADIDEDLTTSLSRRATMGKESRSSRPTRPFVEIAWPTSSGLLTGGICFRSRTARNAERGSQ